jgi:hypothetical protein
MEDCHQAANAMMANKALHWTAISLRFIAAGELDRYASLLTITKSGNRISSRARTVLISIFFAEGIRRGQCCHH